LYIIKISEHGQQKIKHTEAANGLQQESQETSKNNPHAALQGKDHTSTSAVNDAGGRNGDYTPQITPTIANSIMQN
jgi:hypothetical protein